MEVHTQMKLLLIITLILFTQITFAEKYSGCEDPKYISYVSKRLAFIEKKKKEGYEKSLNDLKTTPFKSLNDMEKQLFLFSNTVLSARFDSEKIALKNILMYEQIDSKKTSYS